MVNYSTEDHEISYSIFLSILIAPSFCPNLGHLVLKSLHSKTLFQPSHICLSTSLLFVRILITMLNHTPLPIPKHIGSNVFSSVVLKLILTQNKAVP